MYWLSVYNYLDDAKKEERDSSKSFVFLEVPDPRRENGRVLVGPDMASEDDIDGFVEQMKGELEEFRKAAKKSLRDYETR